MLICVMVIPKKLQIYTLFDIIWIKYQINNKFHDVREFDYFYVRHLSQP